jgi:hypothetical protein
MVRQCQGRQATRQAVTPWSVLPSRSGDESVSVVAMVPFPSARGPRTVLVGIVLAGIYFGYRQLTAPWLDVDRLPNPPPERSSAQAAARSPTVLIDSVRQFFSGEDAWVRDSRKWFRDGERYLFFNESDLGDLTLPASEGVSDSRKPLIRFSPIAFVWNQKNGDEPLTVTAAAAELERSPASAASSSGDSEKEDAFDFGQEEFGTITGGILRGPTRIRGADGLLIECGLCRISEDTMKIWSSQPVTIHWEGNQVRAESGVDIQLLGTTDGKKGLLAVSDIQSLRLNGRVTCELSIPEKDRSKPPTKLQISAPDGFEYHVQTRVANFFGTVNVKKTERKHQIHVQHPEPSGKSNHLFCSRLTLQLRPKVQLERQTKKRSSRLELASILAEGENVRFLSEANNVVASTRNLRYTVDTKTLELWNGKFNEEGKPFPISVRQGDSEVQSPRVALIHGEQSEVLSVEFLGPGFIKHRGENEGEEWDALWLQSFLYRQQPEPVVLLSGHPEVHQTAKKIFLTTEESIEMLLRPSAAIPADSGSQETIQPAFSPGRLRPQEITARKNVTIDAPLLSGLLKEQLVIRFQDPPPVQTDVPVHAVSDSETGPAADEKTESRQAPSGYTRFESDTLDAVVLNQPAEQNSASESLTQADVSSPDVSDDSAAPETPPMRLSDIWLKGNVTVEYTTDDQERSFKAAGNMLVAKSGFDGGHDISLFGDPARVVSDLRRVEGQRIDLSELDRKVAVNSSGRLRVVLDRGLNGQPLETPTPLDIYWGDQMVFTGRKAHFMGNVRAVMKAESTGHNIEVTCAGMQVQFSGNLVASRIADAEGQTSLLLQPSKDASPGNSEKAKPDIESILCESVVRVVIDEINKGVVTSRHKSEFLDLKLNLESGDFHAIGPGWVESTQPDGGNRRMVTQVVTARANSAARTTESQLAWLRVDFIESVSGNIHQQTVRLKQHVTAVYGPVHRMGDSIDVNLVDTADLPPQAGILSCDSLTVASTSGQKSDSPSFSLRAERRARLRSQLFSGDADLISYDHSKNQFVLMADEGHTANVAHRPEGAARPFSSSGRRFIYYPKPRNELKGDDIERVAQ